ncbi:MAG: hypothetical protein ACJ77Z_20635 [Thermoleophilaceae bacterium]
MEALGWAFIGLVSIVWLALVHAALRKPVAFDHQLRLRPPEPPERVATRSRRLWLDHEPPTP